MEKSQAEIELAKIKAQNKARQAKYLEKRRAEGKRHLSAMISGETYDKLCRLRDQSIQAGVKKNLGEVLDELIGDERQGTQITETKTDLLEKDPLRIMSECRDTGVSWAEITKKLNDLGIKTGSGKSWKKANAQAFYSRNKD